MTPPRLHKVEPKKKRFDKDRIKFIFEKVLMILFCILLFIFFVMLCFWIKPPTYGWLPSILF